MVTHRYLGVSLGALILLWGLSGMVMLFVRYPEVSPRERLAALPPIDWSRCCDFGEVLQGPVRINAASIEDLAGAPVLRLETADGERLVIDLSSGRPLQDVSAATARLVAARHERFSRESRATAVERDQWTVTGYFNDRRPFWRVRLADGQGTEVYVSRRSGEVVQRTTTASRLLNWLGAIPHWLYPAILRQHTALWAQVVIWTSLIGVFLTVTGLYLGLVAWRPFRHGGPSPYRGLLNWHHLTGLATGVLTLTWVASGLVSMNPWGFLESPPDRAEARLLGEPITFAEVQSALSDLAQTNPIAAHVELARLQGRLYLLNGDQRLDALARPAPLTEAQLAKVGRSLGNVASQGLIHAEDAYYFSHHEAASLPAWRVVTESGVRYYLDPTSGRLLTTFDPAAKAYRWLHLALHRFDFVPGLRAGPAWAAAMVILLAGVSFGVATGVWLAWRRMVHDLRGLRGSKRR
ncbi:PepSY-associated TM helix domain-containing protein [Phenylobacterium sp.]|uniref:PepSY-associated TM helix domain-containing protein n=1 Tax=Phenylobacterium sp. TaxID=1871053 RepID=UPI0025F3B6B9|nr:PepSY-associated TM helix domain-containing protein [Phenylobacterium sp.]